MSHALAVLAFAACTQPCPDTPAFCVQLDAGSCVAWPAGCCYGLQVCKQDATPTVDAGACMMIPTPANEVTLCQ